MQLSSRILTALAVLILAVAVVAVRAGSPGTVEAATGTIDVLNVGTCYTTSDDVFGVGDCDDGDGNEPESSSEGYSVAGRSSITEVNSVYATYAIDPKTSGDQPRAIAINSDVIKISIEDTGRDKRTGKLYGVSDNAQHVSGADYNTYLMTAGGGGLAADTSPQDVIEDAIGVDSLMADGLYGVTAEGDPSGFLEVTNNEVTFSCSDGCDATDTGAIHSSGDASLRLGNANDNDAHLEFPMASEDQRGEIRWFGLVGAAGDLIFQDLTDEYIELDEDLSSGVADSIAPWMRVTASVPQGQIVQLLYVYYQTSEEEELVGGLDSMSYGEDGIETPVFVDNETRDANPAPIVLHANGDGNDPAQNLRLKEDGRFSGRYEGYLRLTDADGDGRCESDDATEPMRCNWGIEAMDAEFSDMLGAAVLGVESGPVTIVYRNSKGDSKSVTILIDKSPPAISVDLPMHETASKDDSPDLVGSFMDEGGSGLRESSFKIYADNTSDGKTDATPIWDLRVNDAVNADDDRGYVCVDANEDGDCDDAGAVAVLRAHYSGFSEDNPTYGILKSTDIYKAEEDTDDDGYNDLKTADAEDYEDGDASGTFDTVIRIDFPPDESDDNRYNHEIDLQAVVMDIAGNIGFSDSEASDPTFIHDLGTSLSDGRDAADKHNVVGWYSRHTYFLDDVDPKYVEDDSATGFFLDAENNMTRTSSGVMVVFDGKLDASTVGVGTFEVQLDDGTAATVVDAKVKDEKVYLLIEEELRPDSTPRVDLAAGQSISDRAGNESTDRRLAGIELSDGILPTFTVMLSGGTGLNEDIAGEGSSELTKGQMNISISANEAIQGSPKFSVVCSNLYWGGASKMMDNNVSKFASNRTGSFTSAQIGAAEPAPKHGVPDTDNEMDDSSVPAAETTMCPDHTDGDTMFFNVAVTSALARSGNNWEYQWSNLSSDQAVEDGNLSVIVWGRDRSSYKQGADTLYNYSASVVNFVYDTDLMAAWEGGEGEIVPFENENVFEVRPFVLLDFGGEGTTVDVTSFMVDGTNYTDELMAIEDNEFVWWPAPLAYGTYSISVEANDAANNQEDYAYDFTVKERSAFVLDLLAGWNSVSFPANPVDRALHAVFTNPEVDQVIGWDVTEPVSPWRMATRVDGVWTTSDEVAVLNDVEARYGYWVHSQGFITQAIMLAGKGDRATDGQPAPADIPTDEGWNFVGVVDVDGDQTQDDAGETLRDSNNDPITAGQYLGDYTRAYTWDHINNTWDVLKENEGVAIGSGIWVYYTKGYDIAP